jgi:cytochrome c551/c552
LIDYRVLGALLAVAVAALGQESPSVVEQRIFLKKYCVTCHNDKLRTAGLSIENVNLSDVTHSGEILEKV